jgi:hypothetical protein
MGEVTPCVSCERKYGHLSDCKVALLHQQLDAMIRTNGPNAVRLVLKPVVAEETSKC